MQVKEPSHDARWITRCSTTKVRWWFWAPGSAASHHLGKSTRCCRKVHLLKCRFWVRSAGGARETAFPPSCQVMPYFPDHALRGKKVALLFNLLCSRNIKIRWQIFAHILMKFVIPQSFFFFFSFLFIYLFFNFTILYWFCHISAWIPPSRF